VRVREIKYKNRGTIGKEFTILQPKDEDKFLAVTLFHDITIRNSLATGAAFVRSLEEKCHVLSLFYGYLIPFLFIFIHSLPLLAQRYTSFFFLAERRKGRNKYKKTMKEDSTNLS